MKERGQTPVYYPVFLDLRGKKCIVIGGGAVALRKVMSLLECRAEVRVISPELCPELIDLAEERRIQVSQRRYQPGDLAGEFLAITATDDGKTNRRVAEDARKVSVLVNAVDDAESSDFISPSVVRRGGVTIAISTGGLSPALARRLRERLENDIGEEYGVLARLVDEVRTDMRKEGIRLDAAAWQKALDLDLLAGLVRDGEPEKAKDMLVQRLLERKEEARKV